MTPMDEAWLVLKAQFHFEPNLRETTMDAGWVPLSVPNKPDWGTAEWESEIENRPAELNMNLGHYKWPYEVQRMSDGEFKEPEYGFSDGVPNSYWKHYDKKYDEHLVNSIVNTLRHEGIHEALNNTPEMRQAFVNAKREQKSGNPAPYHQWKIVHETMANFQPPDYQGDKENVKTYPWFDNDLWEEAQKVRQGGWE